MVAIGRISGAARDWKTGKINITFEIDSGASEEAINEIAGLEILDIEAKKHTVKRSLDANAYFHVLVGKIADKIRISKARAKNILLGSYGQREIENGHPVILSAAESIDMLEYESIHCVNVGFGVINDKIFCHWAVVRPSHTYNSAEMAILIDGAVQDAKDLGIETATPEELEKMKVLYEKHCARKERMPCLR